MSLGVLCATIVRNYMPVTSYWVMRLLICNVVSCSLLVADDYSRRMSAENIRVSFNMNICYPIVNLDYSAKVRKFGVFYRMTSYFIYKNTETNVCINVITISSDNRILIKANTAIDEQDRYIILYQCSCNPARMMDYCLANLDIVFIYKHRFLSDHYLNYLTCINVIIS